MMRGLLNIKYLAGAGQKMGDGPADGNLISDCVAAE